MKPFFQLPFTVAHVQNGFHAVFQYDSALTHQPAMFESSFLSDVINLYYMLPNDLVGPTGDMLDSDTLLNRIPYLFDLAPWALEPSGWALIRGLALIKFSAFQLKL